MSKRVRAAEPLGVRINETQLDVLRALAGTGPAAAPRVVSVRQICAEVGRSVPAVRVSVRGLVQQGLVEPRRRYLANGGQLENEYVVSELGHRVLEAAARQ